MPVHQGFQDGYHWLVSTEHSLRDWLSAVPHLVVGRYVAITSFDSSPLQLTEAEIAEGWASQGGVAYSPKVDSVKILPFDDNYDEWYVYPARVHLGQLMDSAVDFLKEPTVTGEGFVFVNYDVNLFNEGEEAHSRLLRLLFWDQISRSKPESYLASSAFTVLATTNKELFSQLLSVLRLDPIAPVA